MNLVEVVTEMRDLGVSEFEYQGPDHFRVSFFPTPAPTRVSVPIQPFTPEQSGKADQAEEPPKKDIFDVLESGLIPGAPSRDGLAGTPGSS